VVAYFLGHPVTQRRLRDAWLRGARTNISHPYEQIAARSRVMGVENLTHARTHTHAHKQPDLRCTENSEIVAFKSAVLHKVYSCSAWICEVVK